MSSKAITPQPPAGASWRETPAGAPSLLRREDPTVPRTVGLVAACLLSVGAIALTLNKSGKVTPLGNGWASFFVALGICGLLFHAAFDFELQFRRLYMAFAYLLLALGALVCFIPYPERVGDQFGMGFGLMFLALFFLLAYLRNEDDVWFRQLAQVVLGVSGVAMAATGVVGGNVTVNFLVPYGALLMVLGLIYLACFVSSRSVSDDLAWRTALVFGLVGVLLFLIAFVRSIAPLFVGRPAEYLVPAGILLMLLGVLYAFVALLLTSDQTFVVLTRREIGAFFCSPIVYMVLIVCVLAHGLAYFMYMLDLLDPNRTLFEPIVRGFILQWPPVIFTVLVVPALTMRLLSEEKRSGTMEVLLTAPVSETSVALSKFLAAFVLYLVSWLPMALYLVYMRLDTGKAFDYRPLLSFFVALCVTGAGFVAMGVFFSSVTRNQIISFVMTAVGMLFLVLVFLIHWALKSRYGDSTWVTVLTHMSFLDVWINTLDGKLQPSYLIFFGSLTVFWLFLTVKVLEARKWAA